MSFTKARKSTTERTAGLSKGDALVSRSVSTSSTNSSAPATMSEAQSSLNTPGTMRLSGFTAQSVSAIVNCPSGLNTGARKACIQNRTHAASMKRSKTALRTSRIACVNIFLILSQRFAQLARALARGRDGLHEVVLHAGLLQHLERAPGRAALRGDLRAQHR